MRLSRRPLHKLLYELLHKILPRQWRGSAHSVHLSLRLMCGVFGIVIFGSVQSNAQTAQTTPTSLSIRGQVAEKIPASHLGAWFVSPFGKPLKLLGYTPLQQKFTLNLPVQAPDTKLQKPLNERVTWPALIFENASAPAKVAEAKFFVFQDANKNNKRDVDEPLKEATLNTPKGEVFAVWSSADTVVNGSKGYRAQLKKGWNLLTVVIQGKVQVNTLGTQVVSLSVNN